MAVNPHHVNTNVKVAQGKSSAMVLKSNTLSNQLSAPAMKITEKTMTPQKLFAEKGVTPSQNKKSMMNKAPRRVGADDVMATKLGFMLAYDYDETEGVVIANDYLYGGWEVEMEQQGDNQFGAYLYFTGIPFTINVDYEAKTAEMVMETLAGFQWADTVSQGSTTIINDTTEYIALWDEAFMMNDDAAAEPANLQGTLYDDGTIYFPDGWTLYDVQYIKKTTIRNNRPQVTYDTVAGLLCDYMHETYLITSNATHQYVSESTGNTANIPAYMFQYDDTTAVAWNLWGMGNRGMEFIINEDGSMIFPTYQVAYTEDISSYADKYPQYDWSQAYEFFTFGISLNEDGTGTIEDSLSEDDVIGTVDAAGLYWDASVLYDMIAANGKYYFGIGFYPFIHNKLTFNSEEDFFMLGTTETPLINVVVNDENVVVTGAPANDEETVVLLYIYDPETETATMVDNPYTVERTDADQTIVFAALAQAYGKNVSEWAVEQVVIPALEGDDFLRGDVDGDQTVGVADVTALIDYILTGEEAGIDMRAADTDMDETIGVADVTALIDYILTGAW